MSGLTQWLLGFRQLHEKARRGQLSEGEQLAYRAGRDELARALLAAQRLTLRPGETPRRALRVARALQVDLDLVTSRERAVTIDLSTGAFASRHEKPPVETSIVTARSRDVRRSRSTCSARATRSARRGVSPGRSVSRCAARSARASSSRPAR